MNVCKLIFDVNMDFGIKDKMRVCFEERPMNSPTFAKIKDRFTYTACAEQESQCNVQVVLVGVL